LVDKLRTGGWIVADASAVGWSDPAHVQLTPMPMVNNAMARVHAAVTTAFATVVRLHIVIFPSQIKGVEVDTERRKTRPSVASACDYRL